MRDFHLRFYDNRWYDGMIDLINDDIDAVPETAGAYVLGASDGNMFIYPWGSSPVFYIGKADVLSVRLSEHKKYIIKAINDHEEQSWWPRYQYGASFGAKAVWYSVRGIQNPNKLESDLITQFYSRFGSIPVANGAWPSGLKKPTHGSRED